MNPDYSVYPAGLGNLDAAGTGQQHSMQQPPYGHGDVRLAGQAYPLTGRPQGGLGFGPRDQSRSLPYNSTMHPLLGAPTHHLYGNGRPMGLDTGKLGVHLHPNVQAKMQANLTSKAQHPPPLLQNPPGLLGAGHGGFMATPGAQRHPSAPLLPQPIGIPRFPHPPGQAPPLNPHLLPSPRPQVPRQPRLDQQPAHADAASSQHHSPQPPVPPSLPHPPAHPHPHAHTGMNGSAAPETPKHENKEPPRPPTQQEHNRADGGKNTNGVAQTLFANAGTVTPEQEREQKDRARDRERERERMAVEQSKEKERQRQRERERERERETERERRPLELERRDSERGGSSLGGDTNANSNNSLRSDNRPEPPFSIHPPIPLERSFSAPVPSAAAASANHSHSHSPSPSPSPAPSGVNGDATSRFFAMERRDSAPVGGGVGGATTQFTQTAIETPQKVSRFAPIPPARQMSTPNMHQSATPQQSPGIIGGANAVPLGPPLWMHQQQQTPFHRPSVGTPYTPAGIPVSSAAAAGKPPLMTPPSINGTHPHPHPSAFAPPTTPGPLLPRPLISQTPFRRHSRDVNGNINVNANGQGHVGEDVGGLLKRRDSEVRRQQVEAQLMWDKGLVAHVAGWQSEAIDKRLKQISEDLARMRDAEERIASECRQATKGLLAARVAATTTDMRCRLLRKQIDSLEDTDTYPTNPDLSPPPPPPPPPQPTTTTLPLVRKRSNAQPGRGIPPQERGERGERRETGTPEGGAGGQGLAMERRQSMPTTMTRKFSSSAGGGGSGGSTPQRPNMG